MGLLRLLLLLRGSQTGLLLWRLLLLLLLYRSPRRPLPWQR